MEGGPLAERIRARGRRGRAGARRDRARDGAGRRGPGLDDLHPPQARGGRRGGDRARPTCKLPEDISQEDARRCSRAAERGRRRSTGSSSSCRCRATSTRRGVMLAIDPVKDVDGVHPFNAGQLYLGRPTLVPATPLGIMALLAEYRIALDGARAVVDRPQRHRRQADRAPAAAGERDRHDLPFAHRRPRAAHARRGRAGRRRGRPGIVSPDMVKSGAAVVDVGINRTEAGLVGDVDPGAAERRRASSRPCPAASAR